MTPQNIFFYAGTAGKQEQQFAQKLLELDSFANMIILPGGCDLNSPLSLKLRSGDLMILCASSEESLESLLSISEKFENFRVILVLSKHDQDLLKKSLDLNPRYITNLAGDLEELNGVVKKIISTIENTRSLQERN
ncbi:MAG: hypothetical protein GY702_16175 [Desulfobulbaceae bacterium]|nr:hypothetical protein [Desulfobulbaceae bacterium]